MSLEFFTINEDLRYLCCDFSAKAGDKVKYLKQTSKNRVLVEVNGGVHKVKFSSLKRVTDES